MTLRTKLSLAYGAILAGVVAVAVLGFLLRRANDEHEAFQARRYHSNRLADELRQSSDDLTRFARTYVVTRDPRFERMYFEVLDIRNGKKPRPEGYERVYWDLVLNAGDKPTPDSPEAIPLQELLRRAGITQTEFELLAEAQRNSDALVNTELIAMNMVKGLYDDGSGRFTRKAAPDLATARQLMHDAAYHRFKAAIMRPIGEFQRRLAGRTAKEVDQSLRRRNAIYDGMQATLVMLALLTIVLVRLKTQQHGLEALVVQRTAALGQKITELERAERALTDSDRQLHTIADNVPAVVSHFDAAEMRYRFVNRAFGETFGVDPAQAPGRLVREVIGDEAFERATPYVQRALAGERVSYDIEMQPRGVRRWFNVNYVPEPDAQGRVLNLTVLAFDITARKQAEEALRESDAKLRENESRYRSFIAHSSEGIYRVEIVPPASIDMPPPAIAAWINEHAIVAEVNDALAAMYGLTPADMIGRPAVAFAPDYGTRALAALRSHDLQVLNAETMDIGADGKPLWLWESFHGELEEGRLARFWGVQRNITDRKRTEEERRTLQEQLSQALRMESVGRLAGGVAHDFNNMLGVILGHADLALGELDDANPLRPGLEEIRKAAERSAALTRQLLAFARKQTVAPKVLDLNETVEGTLKMLRRLIGEDIELAWKPAAGLWPVKVDPSQIDQALANLAVNARDAISGVGRVTIATANVVCDDAYCAAHPGLAPGSYVRLDVIDDGCGMDAVTQAHLFEPFFTTKEQGRGTGLGLATVYGSVKQNGGFVEVVSEPGRGTTIGILLPRHDSAAGQASAESGLPTVSGGAETVLLVEDEPAILQMGKTMLGRLGYRVLAANTPADAIQLAATHSGNIDLLVTDVVMPGMNGRDLAARIISRWPSIACLYMSGYTSDIIAHHGVVDDGMQFIQKPFSMNELAGKVREALDKRAGG